MAYQPQVRDGGVDIPQQAPTWRGKRVIIRADLNVPLRDDGTIASYQRVQAVIPTVRAVADAGARVLLLSHLGRPKAGVADPAFSLSAVATYLGKQLDQPVSFHANWPAQAADLQDGQVGVAENVRFLEGETSNSPELAQQMAAHCDVFIMDAFATLHREHASTVGLAKFAPESWLGPLVCRELEALDRTLANHQDGVLAIVAGSKVSTKIHLLRALIEKVDLLFVGGGIANTWLMAHGYEVGESLKEESAIAQVHELDQWAKHCNTQILLPQDVVVENADGSTQTVQVDQVGSTQRIFDVGALTVSDLAGRLARVSTVLWNGPVGRFEIEPYDQGTRALAHVLARNSAYTVVGGGDTVRAVTEAGVLNDMSYVSTGGGAFLAYCENQQLPILKLMASRALTQTEPA